MTMTAPTQAGTASIQVMERLYDGFAQGDTSVVDELCAPEYVDHAAATQGEGQQALENLKAAILDVHKIMPDAQWQIEDYAEKGDTIWTMTKVQGRADGEYFGTHPNTPVELYAIDVCRIRNGKIVEHWGVSDRFELLVQTGLISRLETGTAP